MKTKGWAIAGTRGLYTGWWLTRKEAIRFHYEALGKTWAQCRAKGDRAVKVEISYS
jgi:hypothetical protein